MVRGHMKNFLTSLLGSLVALIVFVWGSVAVMVGISILVFSSAKFSLNRVGSAAPVVPRGAYLVVDLETTFRDGSGAPEFNIMFLGAGGLPRSLTLRRAVEALRTAADDDRIAGVVIFGGNGATGLAEQHELRGALRDFRESGKPVRAYLSLATTGQYYLASVADEVVLDPFGVLAMPGLASQGLFLKNAFDKLGVGVQVTRVGKYKSAVEPFTSEGFSAENREQLQGLLDDVWGTLVAEMAAGRGLAASAIQAAVDAEGVLMAEAALEHGLVDKLAYRDEFLDELRAEVGPGRGNLSPAALASGITDGAEREGFKQISLSKYARALRMASEPPPGKALTAARKAEAAKAKAKGGAAAASAEDGEDAEGVAKPRGRVAVLYAEGSIVDGRGGTGTIGGDRLAKSLRGLRENPRVSAIVLRVNSPGGSATASEVIRREVELAAAEKPLVVSMGSVAASGGYWISTPAQRIFSEPVTITGSIGVFGVFFNAEGLSEKLGLNFDTVKTGRFADMGTWTRPWSAAELAVAQRSVDWVYDKFIERVAEGRGLAPEFVHEIAQGRVWSGEEAQRLGLVDELGGLREAIAYAAEAAGLEEGRYRVSEYPRAKNVNEVFNELFEEMMDSGLGDARVRNAGGFVRGLWQRATRELDALESYNDPQHVYARLPLSIELAR